MDYLSLWYVITLVGTPEFWGYAALGLAASYLVLRYMVPESPAWKKHKPALKRFLLVFLPSIALFFILTLGVKTFWYVQRPCTPCTVSPGVCNPYCDTDSSFPSGHAGTAFVVFTSLYLAFRRRWLLPLFIIPVLVSYSRIALGVHTWTDVLGGAFSGLIVPVLVPVMLHKKHKLK